MTVSVNSTMVLASFDLVLQDVINTSPKASICEALIQMAKTSVINKLPFLVTVPRTVSADGHCNCPNHAICEDWTMDEDTIRSEFDEGNYEYVTMYVNDILNFGPTGNQCLWIEFRHCLKGDSE